MSYANLDSLSTKRDRITSFAQTFLKTPYIWGGASPKGFDCTGYLYFIYKHFGIKVSRASSGYENVGKTLELASVKPADILLFTGTDCTWLTNHWVFYGFPFLFHCFFLLVLSHILHHTFSTTQHILRHHYTTPHTPRSPGRLNATLAVSRGFGDLPHKKLLTDVLPHARRDEQMKSALLACPEVLRFQRKEYVWWLCTVYGGCVLCMVVVYCV